MSAEITLHCDRVGRDTACAKKLVTDAETTAEARSVGDAHGWHFSPGTRQDLCPQHSSGQPGPYVQIAHTGGRSAP